VFLAGESGPGTVALWQQLHAADPRLKLLGASTMADEAFTAELGSSAASTYLTTPVLARRSYPRSAQRVLAAYRRTFGAEATPAALYGYEAMKLVLGAIRAAGKHGDNRRAVANEIFATHAHDSVLGSYTIEVDGETTLSDFGVDVVRGGQPVPYRTLHVSSAELAGTG